MIEALILNKINFIFLLSSYLIGAIPFMSANLINTGSIFTTTYTPYDTRFEFSKIIENLFKIPTDGGIVILIVLVITFFI